MAAAGEPWPTCECHGEPCRWKTRDQPDGGNFTCRVTLRLQMRARRARLAALDACLQCGSLELASETMCRSCLEKHREAVWRHDQQPGRQIRKQMANIRARQRERAREGYGPTGQFDVLIAAELTKASN